MTGMLAAEAAMDLIISGEATHEKGVVPTQYEEKLKESYVYKELKVINIHSYKQYVDMI